MRTSWNAGLKIGDRIRKKKLYLAKPCHMCEQPFFSYPSQKRKYCSTSCRSRYTSHPSRNPRCGVPLSDEHRIALSIGHIGVQARERHPRWKGGISRTARRNDMAGTQYKQWRFAVFMRDGFTCVLCGFKGAIQADHIKPYAQFIALRYDVSNGRTLCAPCHLKTPTFGNRAPVAA